MKIIPVNIPINDSIINELSLGDSIMLTGNIFTGRDAVLPKIVSLINKDNLSDLGVDLQGAVIFHTAVSPAGVGPTSSNKYEIESSIPSLSRAGVKIHLGKGALSESTVKALKKYRSAYAVVPPVSALLTNKILEQRVVSFHEEGMEALHLLRVCEFPAIIAAIHGRSVYSQKN